MGQIKAVFRDVKTEHLEKLFGGAVIAVHEIEGTTVVETYGHGYVLTETEATLLRALMDLDVQRTTDLANVIHKYEDALRVKQDYVNNLHGEIGGLEKKLELEISANEAKRAAINEMRDSLKTAEAMLKSMHPQKRPLYQAEAKDGRKLYTGKSTKKVKK